MFAIQWYDPYDLTPSGKARKDGAPRGRFQTKQEAEDKAEQSIETYGAFDVCYQIVEVS